MTEEKKKLFSITSVKRVDDGLEFEFDLSEDFIEKFKEEQGLKKWSQKRFDEWVTENIDVIARIAGLTAADTEASEEKGNPLKSPRDILEESPVLLRRWDSIFQILESIKNSVNHFWVVEVYQYIFLRCIQI